jgi:hypothetical protein
MAAKLLGAKDMQNTGWLDEHGEIIDPSKWKTEEQGASTYVLFQELYELSLSSQLYRGRLRRFNSGQIACLPHGLRH